MTQIVSYEDVGNNLTDLDGPIIPVRIVDVTIDESGDDINVHIQYRKVDE